VTVPGTAEMRGVANAIAFARVRPSFVHYSLSFAYRSRRPWTFRIRSAIMKRQGVIGNESHLRMDMEDKRITVNFSRRILLRAERTETEGREARAC